MARQSNEFSVAWSSLSGDSGDTGWRTIAITPAGRCALSAGRRFPGNAQAMLVGFKTLTLPATERLPEGQGFSVERVTLPGDTRSWLALTRKENGSPELFLAMVCDVAGLLDHEHQADDAHLLRIFLGRVRAWQEFMRKGVETLSPEAEIGLFGELLCLSQVIDLGVSLETGVASWVGPLDGVQDFEIGTGAIEVKTTLSPVGFPAHVGSLQQLDDATRQPLFLAGVRLRQLATGRTLPELIDDLRVTVAGTPDSARHFAERILRARYYEGHRDQYTRRFEIAGLRIIEVKDAFPRLTPGRVPVGIFKATYDLDIDRAPGINIDLREALKQLGAL